MDSDDDMHDYYDVETIGDDYYIDDDDDVDVDGIDDPAVEKEDHDDRKDFTILSEADVRELQEEAITRLSNVLSISRVESCILLCHYKWDIGKVHDEWFAEEGNIRKTVGLLEQPVVILKKQKLNCGICFETYPCGEMGTTACGHKFCHGCWRGYIGTSISDGPGCLMLRCPEPSCPAAVGQDMINVFVSDEDKQKYSRFLLRSYIESKRKIKWCPAPGCTFAAEFHMNSSNYDVCCRCAHTFCWNCAEEAHRPVLCDTVAKWMLKNSAESENTNWILANSKPCPKCKRPIEKNLGCMHMTCTPPCRFQFCWLCLRAWSDHGRHNGGFYSCNYYQKAKEEGVYEEAETRREMARTSLERYTHYYERWAANQSSRKKALVDLRKMETEKLKKLRVKLSLTASELRFVTEAWEQIVECRRVLTWTYAYGYYLNEHETAKKRLFEYLQGEAEYGLERLHKCTESDLEVFFDAQNPSGNSEFIDFKAKLADLTRVTRNYFKNLVCALENGLQEIDQPLKEEDAGSSKRASESKDGKSKGSKRKKSETTETARETIITAADYENWECTYCTCINPNSTDRCEACEFGR